MIDEGDDCKIIDCEKKELGFIWDGELSASGRRESNAISCMHFEI